MVLLVLKAVMEKYVYVQYHRDKSGALYGNNF